jgi:hypothetical protein
MMKPTTRLAGRILMVVALLFGASSVPIWAAANATKVCGLLGTNSTWSLASGPYEVCSGGVTIGSGATLTIEPGVNIQFQPGSGSKLYIQGALVARGTPTQRITFTGVVPTPGSWAGLSADGTVTAYAAVSLDYATLEYGGINGSYGAQVYADRAAVAIAHSLIRNSAGSGFYATQHTQCDVHATSFVGNGLNAILLLSQTAVDLSMTDLSASGNGTNGIRLGGTTYMSGQRRWAFPGIPYIVDSIVSNQAGDVLTIDPGNSLEFSSAGWLSIGGHLSAIGSASQPIMMTGMVKTPGSWRGLFVYGGSYQAMAQLDYVTIEYAGNDIRGANIEVGDGSLIAHHSIVRYSLKDGIRFDSNAGGSILESQITGNTLYGVFNMDPTRAVLATNNWWGDAGGPRSDVAGCSGGKGDRVTAGVLFLPVLTSADAKVPFPLSNAPMLKLSPRRWFIPADGTTKAYFDIALQDGNGSPIPGRKVRIKSTLGSVTDGGITDAAGKTLAYLTSTKAGDAEVTATLDATTACEGALSPSAKMTFTTPISITDLLPNAPASYLAEDLKVSPLPVMTGVPTTVTAVLTNPLAISLTVDVEFGFAQAGIGLAFGPIKDYVGQVIPANSSTTLSATWVPTVSGHYCVQVSYSISAVGTAGVVSQTTAGKSLKQFNLNVYQAPVGSPAKQGGLEKTRKSLKAMNKFVDKAYDTGPIAIPLAIANKGIGWDLDNAEKISNALNGDPPRQDYTLIDVPHKLSLPPMQAGNGISAARATALNELDDALAEANAYGTAAAVALDRYGGASAARDLQWASVQSAALLEYNRQMGVALVTAAQKIDNVIAVASSEGVTSVIFSIDDITAMQKKLASGFSAQQIADAHTVGLTDEDIEAVRQSILKAKPEDLAVDLIPEMQHIRDQFIELGNVLQNPGVFAPGVTITGGQVLQAQAAGNSLARVYSSETSVQLANPLTQTAQIDVRTRRIDLPADWTVAVSPAQVSLAPGAQTTVTVSVGAGSPALQGSTPRVAVEGFAGAQLLGGVVIDILVPKYAPFTCNGPGKPTLTSPSGNASTTPTYSWNAVGGAKWYQLWVDDSMTSGKIKQWYTGAEVGCPTGLGTCSITPATALAPGIGTWWIQAWNDCSGGSNGPWSDGMKFLVPGGSLPGKATLIAPTGSISTTMPVYGWNAVPTATWYQLWVNDSATSSGKIIQWYPAAAAGCGSGLGNCSVTPTIPLAAGAAQWWIQTWNEAGYGPWSDGMAFIVGSAGPPGKATLVSPTGDITTTNPVYAWNAVPAATWYQLWVSDGTGSPKIQSWYTAAQSGCVSGTGSCSVTPATSLAPGAYEWWIQTWNDSGYGPWSDSLKFNLGAR